MTKEDRNDDATGAEFLPRYDPASETDTQAKQDTGVAESGATDDVDADEVKVLPGTGGPDDVGEIEVDPGELNMSGESIPGHPKPGDSAAS
jgi:hypothetical protein